MLDEPQITPPGLGAPIKILMRPNSKKPLPSGYALTLDDPDEICLEIASSSGSLPPAYAWRNRRTLFGSGELQLLEVKGYLPHFTEVRDGKLVSGLQLSSKNSHLAPRSLLKDLVFTNGRLCIARTASLDHAAFTWTDEDGETGSAKLTRVKSTHEVAAAVLKAVFEKGIWDFPEANDEIVYETGGGDTTIVFACELDGVIFRKTVKDHFYAPDYLLVDRFREISRAVDEGLEKLHSLHQPLIISEAVKTYFVGRRNSSIPCDIALPEHEMSVSRKHLEITPTADGQCYIVHTTSQNTTQLLNRGVWQPISQTFVELDTPLLLGAYQTTARRLLAMLPKID